MTRRRQPFISEMERQAARLRQARAHLERRGTRIKAILRNDPPATGYQLTGFAAILSAAEVIAEAVHQGWRG